MSLLFPNKCAACGKIVTDKRAVCADCVERLHRITGKRCLICGRETGFCSCTSKKRAFSRIVSAFRYDGAARDIISRYKFHKTTALAEYIASELSELVDADYGDVDFSCITFVPCSPSGLAVRGFDQCELIARSLAKRTGIPCLRLLSGALLHKPQKYRGRAARERVYSDFRARKAASGRVLLVDDVTTTGATLDSCAMQLLNAGAAEVYCITFASTYKK